MRKILVFIMMSSYDPPSVRSTFHVSQYTKCRNTRFLVQSCMGLSQQFLFLAGSCSGQRTRRLNDTISNPECGISPSSGEKREQSTSVLLVACERSLSRGRGRKKDPCKLSFTSFVPTLSRELVRRLSMERTDLSSSIKNLFAGLPIISLNECSAFMRKTPRDITN